MRFIIFVLTGNCTKVTCEQDEFVNDRSFLCDILRKTTIPSSLDPMTILEFSGYYPACVDEKKLDRILYCYAIFLLCPGVGTIFQKIPQYLVNKLYHLYIL